MLVILVAGILGLITAAPSPKTCPTIMEAGKITDSFIPLVTHAIHAITVEDIRYYFEENVTEENNIPTVNMNTTSEQRVLLYAPLAGYDETITSHAMKQFDRVVRNMDKPEWGIPSYTLLEKVSHAIHMSEIWEKSVEQYKIAAKLLDPQSDLCTCVRDIENNGILQYLNLLAFKIRYPGIATGNETITARYLNPKEKRSVAFSDPYYAFSDMQMKYAFSDPYYAFSDMQMKYASSSSSVSFRSALMNFDFNKPDFELLADVATQLVDGDGVMTVHIDSPENWEYWKNLGGKVVEPEEADFYNIAAFLFCMLH